MEFSRVKMLKYQSNGQNVRMGGRLEEKQVSRINKIEHHQPKIIHQLTSSIFEAEIGESPHISEAHSIRHAGEGKIPLTAPRPSFILLYLLLLLILLVRNSFTLPCCLSYQVSDGSCEDIILCYDNHDGELCWLQLGSH